MLILRTGLLAHYLTFINLFIMSFYWNGGGYQSPLFIVLNSTDKVSKITVQKRLENLYHPPEHFHFPVWAKTKFRGQRSSKILGSIPDLQVGGKQSMSLLSPYHHYSHKCFHSRLLLSCMAVLVKNRESTCSEETSIQWSRSELGCVLPCSIQAEGILGFLSTHISWRDVLVCTFGQLFCPKHFVSCMCLTCCFSWLICMEF